MPVQAGIHLGPYEVLAPLGAGGMGEVYRARDVRLDRTVALKVLPQDFLESEQRKRRFEKEAKLLASLNHPNIAILYSFEEISGSPPSSSSRHVLTMELLEGESLREVLLRRTPTTRQVLSWAVQAAQGLSAAHLKGIVHRDIKPENLFLTSDGRLKILDFGLAKLVARTPAETEAATAAGASTPGVIVGTVAYMSPEQIEAEGLDPRSDVFSLGVVLYELLAREHPFRRPTVPATLTAIVNETPLALSTRLPEILPGVDRIVRRCLEKRREERYQSAQELTAALEAVLEGGSSATALRDVEEKSPYPGLSAFTEEDAGRFFGREEEVEALWRKLHDRKLLAVIGPSGAGKSSFVRAGVVAARPEGWAPIVATPGNAPLRSLGQALAPRLAHDPEALRKLLTFDDPESAFELLSRWRRSNEEALVVLDQFEELFTLNPPETQARFAALLGKLAKDADVHVLLSMRDDFLMRCPDQPPLAPIFEALTPLKPMTHDGLRRALVEPASRRGYRFEDDTLVDEMISAVEGARGALPLLAFAVSRLWERRKPEEKLLTRGAYVDIGGVAGALARHAEETMDRIGAGMEPTVRDLFRNLTTAQGTRAVLDREELLSSLPDRTAAEAALGKLIDARLLTSWETEATEGQPERQRIEIVHESLLSAWPRLVRWQTQDADGAQLRDQLRQAAHLWEERGKAEDLLWTGSSYLEYRVWRGRYPGKLSSLEEDFAGSMATLAERTRRRRRAAVSSVLVALLVGLGVMALLWNKARVHGVRAEASKLLAMAQAEVGTDPETALAYATKSIELDDTRLARLLALRITQSAPVASELASGGNLKILYPTFSPNGEWLALQPGKQIRLLNQDGREPVTISPGEPPPGSYPKLEFAPDGKLLALGYRDGLRLLSVPDGREIRRVKYEEGAGYPVARKTEGNRHTFFLRPWDGGPQRLIGTLELSEPASLFGFTRDFTAMAYPLGPKVYVHSLNPSGLPPRLVGEHSTDVTAMYFSANGQRLAAVDKSGEIRIWDTASSSGRALRVLPAPRVQGSVGGRNEVSYSPAGGWVVSDTGGEGTGSLRVWNMTAPPGAGPLVLQTKASNFSAWDVDPLDRGIALDVENGSRFLFWPLPRTQPFVFDFREGQGTSVAFTADGATLVAATTAGELRAWPLSSESQTAFRALPKSTSYPTIAAAPTRREIAVVSMGRLQVLSVDGGEPRVLEGLPRGQFASAVAFSRDGRRVAAAPRSGPAKEKRLRVWDLETGALQVLEPVPKANDEWGGGFVCISFLGDDRVLATVSDVGLMLFDLRAGTGKVLSSRINAGIAVGRSGRVGVGTACADENPSCEILRFGVDGSAPVPLPYESVGGSGLNMGLVLDPTETLLASTGPDGVVRIGPISGGEPHLLLGHKGGVNTLAFSPDGKWLASAGDDQTVRLWPVPDVMKVPPHKRSKEEFLATLHSFTNLRAVPDAKAPNGWKVEPGPFPGWNTAPHW